MKKIALVLVSVFFLNFLIKADEGMWLPQLLGDKVYADMVKKGLKLSKEQLNSINKNSIKDAIVLFGGGCTGEIVSKEGLLFTNHHCGYSNIAAASTVSHNYLKDGFWAKSKLEEIACPGLSVQFLIKIEDVTTKVLEKIKDLTPTEVVAKLPIILNELSTKATEGTGYEVRINSFFKGNQFLQFTYQRFTDVRLVGTPPESIGKFGGDTDNWQWPRHTADFSIFRVYAGKDGKPSEYKEDNIPYTPKYFLPVSLKGIKDGDYSMTFGYPGSTNRYETSFGVKLKVDIENPSIVYLRDTRLKFMLTEMVKDPAVKIQLAGSYAQTANYWKFFFGETEQLIKHNVIGLKESEEAKFTEWAKAKPEYDNLFSKIKNTYDNWRPYSKHLVYLNEGILGSPLLAFANNLKALDNAVTNNNTNEITKISAVLKTAQQNFIKSENITSDKKILATVLKLFYNDIDVNQHPQAFYTNLKSFGALDKDETYAKFSEQIFETSFLLQKEAWANFIAKPDTAILHKDLAYKTVTAFTNNFNQNYNKFFVDFNSTIYALNNSYLKGILEMRGDKNIYPDANQTMRVSYGNVKSYDSKDGLHCKEICTVKGIIEKYKPNDYEFDVPTKLLELIKNKDYGQYIDKQTNELVVSFITNNDITGGNSGSPVINGNGELIGLAFDGNYEALGHKLAMDNNLNRTICLDVRYLLFVVDKFGGAKNIINELQLVK